MTEAQQIVMSEAPWVFIAYPGYHLARRANLKGFTYYTSNNIRFQDLQQEINDEQQTPAPPRWRGDAGICVETSGAYRLVAPLTLSAPIFQHWKARRDWYRSIQDFQPVANFARCGAPPECSSLQPEKRTMGKLSGKVAVVTGLAASAVPSRRTGRRGCRHRRCGNESRHGRRPVAMEPSLGARTRRASRRRLCSGRAKAAYDATGTSATPRSATQLHIGMPSSHWWLISG